MDCTFYISIYILIKIKLFQHVHFLHIYILKIHIYHY